ncbi:uncharacterized protein CELE_ZC13.2 [Caenorhabditis elegans]|uniref:Transmembrane protein n=1 Tax=Caenorhabditis elegans TaxID=6239 RepID=Q95Q41_CAEEL|nr:Transmembrane protein [Caenorhabditis elegans]CCD70625.1 Transmembrane protein [Caenorhabditis elegans]|eukprot:NP_508172.1 Uncharacterized protein CELE_ZC13.2 [Caenorhabditis elegans]
MAHLNHAYLENPQNGGQDPQRRALNSLSPTFFIKPKTTGLISLFIQTVILIISASISLFFFYHVGGYEYTHWNENSTILEPINHNINKIPLPMSEGANSLVSTVSRKLDFLEIPYLYNDSADVETVNLLLDSSGVPDIFMENASFGIEQVPMTTVIIGDIEFDWLEVIRISTIVYLVIICFWFGSGVFFIFTIRCEVLDTAIFNTTILILVVLFQIAHAGLVTSLIFFQREMSWRTLSITIGTIVILFCCAFLGFVCITLNCGWVKYIDYMHGKKKCSICSLFSLCCGKKEPLEAATSNGTAPTNTRPYEDDVPLDRFDAF